jgi:hypothetical protein
MFSHSFYEKPITDKVIMADSALPTRMKIATLSQEVIRRMKNIERNCSIEERVKVLDQFMAKMTRSNHTKETGWLVLESGLKGYYKFVQEQKGGPRLTDQRMWGRGREK